MPHARNVTPQLTRSMQMRGPSEVVTGCSTTHRYPRLPIAQTLKSPKHHPIQRFLHLLPALLIYSTLTPYFITQMCYREVQCTRHVCGHEEPFSESKIDCQSDRCRYSSLHVRGCATCPSTCNQMLGHSRNVVTQRKETFCYHCRKQNTS